LLDENVHYINDLGRFIDGSTIELVHATEKNASSRFPNKQQKSTISADAFVVAVGGRPKALDIPGGTFIPTIAFKTLIYRVVPMPRYLIIGDEAITSDDLFSRSNLSNGTTGGNTVATPRVLVIGGSYVALECAGILNSLGADVTCLHR
jgi:thioredoxin reductase (NADPH)